MSLISIFHRYYGQTAFGLVALLAVWYMIVGPALRDARVDSAALRSITDTLSKTAMTNENSARIIEATATRMERLAERLNLPRQ